MRKRDIFVGLVIALALGMGLSLFASSWPDGLERVAEDKGFFEKSEVKPAVSSPIPDYVWPNIKNEKLATSLAGGAGTLMLFVLGYGLAAILRKVNQNATRVSR